MKIPAGGLALIKREEKDKYTLARNCARLHLCKVEALQQLPFASPLYFSSSVTDTTPSQPQATALHLSAESVSKLVNSGSGQFIFGWVTISWDYTRSIFSFTGCLSLFSIPLGEVTLTNEVPTATVSGGIDSITAQVTFTLEDTPTVAYQIIVQANSLTLIQKSGTITL